MKQNDQTLLSIKQSLILTFGSLCIFWLTIAMLKAMADNPTRAGGIAVDILKRLNPIWKSAYP
ncbi:MAG: hypothetical protein IT559_02670 [Alphaproteobacteria bacterium]|nr:hypothetical protein [Alphaproteobacteria bacterium]